MRDFTAHFVGDPTVFGNMLPHESIKQALHKVIDSNMYNGYFNAAGSPGTVAPCSISQCSAVINTHLKRQDVRLQNASPVTNTGSQKMM